MATESSRTELSNGATSAQDLFALTDEQILQIEPDMRDVEIFGGERSDRMDPLREDLDLLADANGHSGGERDAEQGNGKVAVAGSPASATTSAAQHARPGDATTADDVANAAAATGEAPQWLAERMNDPQLGAEARELWQGVQATRQEASAFREVFAKPEDARAAADRARTLDEFDRAYFGVPGNAPEQTSASRSQLAQQMLREDPAAFREMVFAGLRALEGAGQQGIASANAHSAPQAHNVTSTQDAQRQASQGGEQRQTYQPTNQPDAQRQENLRQQETRVAAYADFERAANEELARGVSGAIERSLQQALPNASRTENGASLKQRLATAVRQDVEKALQGDQSLGEQVARMLSGQRLDNTTRAQVVRVIGERAQQLVPSATRRVLADWTQTTLATHNARATSSAANAGQPRSSSASPPSTNPNANNRARESQRTPPRKIDYRRVSDNDILDS